jgi:FMN phosphatase YigB (HAD superfamily)
MKANLLLDFDGVMLKNSNLTMYQFKRSVKFVQKHTYLPLSVCEEMNNTYYPKYGHTVMMLNQLFQKNVSLEQYNQFVFGKNNLKKLNKLVDKDTFNHFIKFEKITNYCKKNGIDWNIFTNAHINWITNFCEFIDFDGFNETKVIWPSDITLLKPNSKAYENAEKFIDFDPAKDIIFFVDDSSVNVESAKTRNWKTTIMNDTTKPEDILYQIQYSNIYNKNKHE